MAKISSTDEEKAKALDLAHEVRDYLRAKGWPEPILADSGNGYHLLYPVDLPNDQDSAQAMQGALEGLHFTHSGNGVNVDTSVFNAARIWKVYGTTARKGDNTEERPHRPARILEVPKW
jgi:hypothetical protein